MRTRARTKYRTRTMVRVRMRTRARSRFRVRLGLGVQLMLASYLQFQQDCNIALFIYFLNLLNHMLGKICICRDCVDYLIRPFMGGETKPSNLSSTGSATCLKISGCNKFCLDWRTAVVQVQNWRSKELRRLYVITGRSHLLRCEPRWNSMC